MIRFAEVFPDKTKKKNQRKKKKKKKNRNLIYIEDSLAREFYTEMCRLERWSVRVLQEKIRGMLFCSDCSLKEAGRTRPKRA
ncbi:MAG TPA: DUF1016 N-terminal domain-containing protein, partial [Smithellaceae bacterium]|nr:DUF1016 N-terminal domain-containing protein [Smithellaceae bacterium]